MKKVIALGLGGLVGLAAAQDIPGLSDLPECGVSAPSVYLLSPV